jgi:hypothetical protein
MEGKDDGETTPTAYRRAASRGDAPAEKLRAGTLSLPLIYRPRKSEGPPRVLRPAVFALCVQIRSNAWVASGRSRGANPPGSSDHPIHHRRACSGFGRCGCCLGFGGPSRLPRPLLHSQHDATSSPLVLEPPGRDTGMMWSTVALCGCGHLMSGSSQRPHQ